MRIYWTVRQIPELAALPRAERGVVWRRAYARAFRHWQTWAGLVSCGALAGVGGYVGGLLGHAYVGAGVGGGVGGFVFWQVVIHVILSHYKHLLTSDGDA